MKCPNGHESQATDYCDTCGAAMGDAEPATPDSGMPADGTPASSAPAAAAQPADANVLSLEEAEPEPGGQSDPGVAGAAPAADDQTSGGDRPCPNCGAPNSPDALFCEVCGYDHTTGSMPRTAPLAVATGDAAEAEPASANPSKALDQPWVAEIWIDPAWYSNQGSPDPLPSAGPPAVVALRHTSLLVGRVSVSRDIHPDIDCGTDNGVSRRHAQLTSDGKRWWVEDLESSNGTYLAETVGDLPTSALPPRQKREFSEDDRIYVGSWTRIVIRPSSSDEIDALA